MSLGDVSSELTTISDLEVQRSISGVHNNEDVVGMRVSISEGGDEQVGVGGVGVDALVAGEDEAREMTHVVVRRLEVDLLSISKSDDGGVTVALEMVGTSLRIENHVPVDPSSSPVIQVSNNIATIVLSTRPVIDEDTRAVAGLSSKQEFIGSNLVGSGEILELSSRIPMEGSTISEITNFRIERGVEEGVDPLSNVILVVIVDHDLNLRMVLLHDRRQVVLEMIKHIRRTIDAGLPRGGKLGLVLDGHSPEVDTLSFVGVEVGGNVASISVVNLRLREKAEGLSRAIELLVDLHPRRRRPGGGEHLDGVHSVTMSGLNERKEMLTIGINAEVAHMKVARSGSIGVAFNREIAASNVSTAQSVVVSGSSEIGLQNLLLKIRVKLREDVASSISKSASKAFNEKKNDTKETKANQIRNIHSRCFG